MENPPFNAFRTIVMYTLFILAAPISTFFISKFVLFESIIGASELTGNVWSAILAVIMLHIALALYIYKAYYEAEKVKPVDKTD